MADDDSRLSNEAKDEIRKQIYKVVLPFGALLSLITFFMGFFAKDVAQKTAEADYIKSNFAAALSSAVSANTALAAANAALANANDLSARIKTLNSDSEGLSDRSRKILAEAQTIQKTIDTSKALQDAQNVVEVAKNTAADIIGKLKNDGDFEPIAKRISLQAKGISAEQEFANFWNANPSNTLKYNCDEGSFLSGMEFDMAGKNEVRTPTRVKYICRPIVLLK